jgi:hypothetical protein
MFPITKPELSFAEISKYWAPELRWSRDMVQALLEGALLHRARTKRRKTTSRPCIRIRSQRPVRRPECSALHRAAAVTSQRLRRHK